MQKYKRYTGELGSGSGKEVFADSTFRVLHWYRSEGHFTEVEFDPDDCSSRISLYFEGHLKIDTANKCVAQFHASEILRIIKHAKKTAFEEGRVFQQREIQASLGLR